MNVATGTKERNGPQRIKSQGRLRLVSSTELPKKIYRIGVCENIFSPRQKSIRKTEAEGQGANLDGLRNGPNDEQSSPRPSTTVIAYAVFGLVLGYLAGKIVR